MMESVLGSSSTSSVSIHRWIPPCPIDLWMFKWHSRCVTTSSWTAGVLLCSLSLFPHQLSELTTLVSLLKTQVKKALTTSTFPLTLVVSVHLHIWQRLHNLLSRDLLFNTFTNPPLYEAPITIDIKFNKLCFYYLSSGIFMFIFKRMLKGN